MGSLPDFRLSVFNVDVDWLFSSSLDDNTVEASVLKFCPPVASCRVCPIKFSPVEVAVNGDLNRAIVLFPLNNPVKGPVKNIMRLSGLNGAVPGFMRSQRSFVIIPLAPKNILASSMSNGVFFTVLSVKSMSRILPVYP